MAPKSKIAKLDGPTCSKDVEMFYPEDIEEDESDSEEICINRKELPFDEQELSIIEKDEIELIERSRGMTAEDYNEVTSIFEEVTGSLEKKTKLFIQALEASVKSRAAFAANAISEENSEKFEENVDDEIGCDISEQYLEAVKKYFHDTSTNLNKQSTDYIASLSPITVQRSAYVCASYIEFISMYKGDDPPVEELKLDYLKANCVNFVYGQYEPVRKAFRAFSRYLILNYRTKVGNKALEPNSILSMMFGLFVSFKIIGIIEYGCKRIDENSVDAIIKMRMAISSIGCSYPYRKVVITKSDIVAIFKNIQFHNVSELMYGLMIIFLCETGLRNGSATGKNRRINEYEGIKLKDLAFSFPSNDSDDFNVTVNVRHEKQTRDKNASRRIVMSSFTRTSHICAPFMLLLYLDLMGYLEASACESIKNKKVEIKLRFLEFPLFSCQHQGCPIPGTSMNKDEHVFKWLAKLVGVPKLFISSRSCRKGFAMSLVNEYRRKNPNITVQDAIDYLKSTTCWASKACKAYIRNAFEDTDLVPYRLEGMSTESPWEDVFIKNSFSSIVLDDDFALLTAKQLKQINEIVERNFKIPPQLQKDLEECKIKIEELVKSDPDCMKKSVATTESYEKYTMLLNEKQCIIHMIAKRKTKQSEVCAERIMLSRYEKVRDKANRSMPKNEAIVPHLDFEELSKILENVKIRSPLQLNSYISTFDEMPSEGVRCPVENCEAMVFNSVDYAKHKIEAHDEKCITKVKRSGSLAKRLVFKCHHSECTKENLFNYKSFVHHNRHVHQALQWMCLTCDMKLPIVSNTEETKNKHTKVNPNHEIRQMWWFKPFILPPIIKNCYCPIQYPLSDGVQCVLSLPDVSIVFSGTIPEACTKMASQIAGKECTQTEAMSVLCAIILKIPTPELPDCLTRKIQSIENQL